MKEISSLKSVGNLVLIILAILSFILSMNQDISSESRSILLIISPTILVLGAFYIFLNKNDEIISRLETLEDKLKRSEDLIEIKSEIAYLKKRIK